MEEANRLAEERNDFGKIYETRTADRLHRRARWRGWLGGMPVAVFKPLRLSKAYISKPFTQPCPNGRAEFNRYAHSTGPG